MSIIVVFVAVQIWWLTWWWRICWMYKGGLTFEEVFLFGCMADVWISIILWGWWPCIGQHW